MKPLDQILAEHTFFQGLDHQYLELLRGCATNAVYHTDEYLFRENEPASYFYIVRRGRVAVETNGAQLGKITIETIDAGDVVGWSWLFPPYTWTFSARAVEPTGVTRLDGVCLRQKCEQDHNLGYELNRRVASIVIQRLQATRLQLIDAYDEIARGHA